MNQADISWGELEHMVTWIKLRESIRRKREAGLPAPWTRDPLLRDYRWCNVRRMDDRVSRWLFDHFYDCHSYDSCLDFVAATLARLVNWPDSLAAVLGGSRKFTLSHLQTAHIPLKRMAALVVKVFTGAYIVPGVPGQSKIASVLTTVKRVHEGAKYAALDGGTARGTWLELCAVPRLGGFLAGQIVADMAHLWTGRNWPDRETWAPLGPGSLRGMNRLLGRDKGIRHSQEEFEAFLPVLTAVLRPRIADIWDDRGLWAMDVQNCLCEFDKYRRLTLGEGKVRARYEATRPGFF